MTVGLPVESRYVFSTPIFEEVNRDAGEMFEGIDEESRGNGVANLILL
jgi:hypothetical protein